LVYRLWLFFFALSSVVELVLSLVVEAVEMVAEALLEFARLTAIILLASILLLDCTVIG